MSFIKIRKIVLVSALAFALPLILPIHAMATVHYGPIKKGETLWSIAKTHRPAHVSIHQMMLAIQNLNGPLMQNSAAVHQGQILIIPENIQEIRSALHPVSANVAPAPVSAQTPAQAAVSAPVSAPAQAFAQASASMQAPAATPVAGTLAAPVLSISTVSPANPTNPANPNPTNSNPTNPNLVQAAHFPWGWASIVVLLLALAYLIWQRKLSGNLPSDIKKLAALRLGISSKRHEPSTITRYKTRRFKEGLDLSPDQDFGLDPNDTSTQTSPYATHPVSFSHQSAEAMASAMIDMAEKNYDGAERLLKSAITQDQSNLELRVKLLELYMTTNNQAAFKKESDQVEKMVPENSPIWHQIRGMYLNQWAYEG